jgi:tRNA-dependent cyclodipeptide synthase
VPEFLDRHTGQTWRVLGEDEPAEGIFPAGILTAPGLVLLDRLLAHEQCQDIDFFDGDRTVLSIAAKGLRRIVQSPPGELARREAPPFYRAKQERVSPRSAAPGLKNQRRCILGISLQNENFERPERLDAILDWIEVNFDECLILLGDSIHRLTLQIRNPGLGESEAQGRALELGRRFMATNGHLFEGHGLRCRVTPLAMSDPSYRDRHQDWIERLVAFHEGSEPYRRVVGTFASDFARRQAAGYRIVAEEDLRRATQYLLEEAAFCGILGDQRLNVLVYPGSIDPFVAVSEGKIPDAPEPLRTLQLVGLALERQWLPGERPSRVQAVGCPLGVTR